MEKTNDVKMLVVCVLIADLFCALIYLLKGDVVGLFNCLAWAVIASFVLFNFKRIFESNHKV